MIVVAVPPEIHVPRFPLEIEPALSSSVRLAELLIPAPFVPEIDPPARLFTVPVVVCRMSPQSAPLTVPELVSTPIVPPASVPMPYPPLVITPALEIWSTEPPRWTKPRLPPWTKPVEVLVSVPSVPLLMKPL